MEMLPNIKFNLLRVKISPKFLVPEDANGTQFSCCNCAVIFSKTENLAYIIMFPITHGILYIVNTNGMLAE